VGEGGVYGEPLAVPVVSAFSHCPCSRKTFLCCVDPCVQRAEGEGRGIGMCCI